MKNYLLIAAIFCASHLGAQNFVNIPDPSFASYLQNIIPAAMSGNSLDISNPLVTASIQSIYVASSNISNLTGIQYFSSLVNLDCSNNLLTSLPPIANSVIYLDCSNNAITSITTLPGSLQNFYCHYNSLNSLPALPNSIQNLNCHHNSITSLPTLPNSMQYLFCSENPLGSLPTLPNSLLDLSCWSNSISTLPALPNTLKFLDCPYNFLTSLPTLPNLLGTLVCDNNNLSHLPLLPHSLTFLSCTYNSLTTLPILPDTLLELHCENNKITCLPLLPGSIKVAHQHSNVWTYYISLSPNPFTCLPNYLPQSMTSTLLAYPLCMAGNINGCADGVTGINTTTLNPFQINMYPNPTNGEFNIKMDEVENQLMQLFNINGQLIYYQTLRNELTNINLKGLVNGVYILVIKGNSGIITKKIMVQN